MIVSITLLLSWYSCTTVLHDRLLETTYKFYNKEDTVSRLISDFRSLCTGMRHCTTIITAISRKISPLLGFAFVDDTDLTTAASNAQTFGTELIHRMQALMTHWCGCIRATGGYIAPAKTRWFLISFFWTGTD